jgi:hypothetical protein
MKIKNRKDFEEADINLGLKKFSEDEIIILDIDDVWDGPLSGLCECMNRGYYFYCFDRLEGDDDRWPRKYILINLSKEQLSEYNRLHVEFIKWKNGQVSLEAYQKILDELPLQKVNKNQITGWFESGKNNPSKFMNSYFKWLKQNQ